MILEAGDKLLRTCPDEKLPHLRPQDSGTTNCSTDKFVLRTFCSAFIITVAISSFVISIFELRAHRPCNYRPASPTELNRSDAGSHSMHRERNYPRLPVDETYEPMRHSLRHTSWPSDWPTLNGPG